MSQQSATPHPVLLAGAWQSSAGLESFQACNPATGAMLAERYPTSTWTDCELALVAADQAYRELLDVAPADLAAFLNTYAQLIEQNAESLAMVAAEETGLAMSPRLKDVEIPRTVNQLRQAAEAALDQGWALPTIDTKSNIRSMHGPIGPCLVIGPNNFPFAYNGIAGGDFASAIAAGNPVIAKGHPAHPTTTRLLAELCFQALAVSSLPKGTVQLLYRISHADGLKMMSDPRMAAVGFTGSRHAGLAIKATCDAAGKPSYLEMSSVNPVLILPGALKERLDEVVGHFCTSCLMATGQFCTNPGLVVLMQGPETDQFVAEVSAKFSVAPVGTLLSEGVMKSLETSVNSVIAAGANCLTGGKRGQRPGFSFENTLLRVPASLFLKAPQAFQTEMFGAASLLVVATDAEEMLAVIETFEGNLTGTIYSSTKGSDEKLYRRLSKALRPKVGRLNNDKMPTGVAVVPSMNHGGPYPSTGHAGFTAVGFPACTRRFSMLMCYDAVRDEYLPTALRNHNPSGKLWRLIDGAWTQGNI